MKIGDRVFVRGYVDEIRKDTVIVRNDGGYFGTIPSEVITGALPPAQPDPNCSEIPNNSDTISRQEAIDASEKFIKDCNPEHFVGHQKFIEYMDNAEIGSFGKWQFANGFNMGLTAAEVAIKKLPSAQPTAEPVRHGKWIDDGQYSDNFPHHEWRCSECGEHVIEVDTPWYKYCPQCGARMDND